VWIPGGISTSPVIGAEPDERSGGGGGDGGLDQVMVGAGEAEGLPFEELPERGVLLEDGRTIFLRFDMVDDQVMIAEYSWPMDDVWRVKKCKAYCRTDQHNSRSVIFCLGDTKGSG
jgi:hypothetical protein